MYEGGKMGNRYEFRRIKQEEVNEMFHLIQERMKWMDEKGIEQWNTAKYDEIYPLSYYEDEWRKGEIFVLYDTENRRIVSAAVLKEKDERWENNKESAFYLHNFVAKIGEKGMGILFMKSAEEYAVKKGKLFFRLDSAENNDSLSRYYESQGFLPVGKIKEGLYAGILREKKLQR